jgi:hypothetical protein
MLAQSVLLIRQTVNGKQNGHPARSWLTISSDTLPCEGASS